MAMEMGACGKKPREALIRHENLRDDLTDIDIFSSYDDDNIFDLNNDAIIDLQNVLAAVGGAPAADAGPSLAAT
jgi:hypothetical protein